MRVNVYAEEMTDRIQIISKKIDGQEFTGLRFYLELPVTIGPKGATKLQRGGVDMPAEAIKSHKPLQVSGPFMHHPGDDDSSAVTFWGKRDLRELLIKALEQLDEHYNTPREAEAEPRHLVVSQS